MSDMTYEVPPPMEVPDSQVDEIIDATREFMEEQGAEGFLGMSVRLNWDLAHALKEERKKKGDKS